MRIHALQLPFGLGHWMPIQTPEFESRCSGNSRSGLAMVSTILHPFIGPIGPDNGRPVDSVHPTGCVPVYPGTLRVYITSECEQFRQLFISHSDTLFDPLQFHPGRMGNYTKSNFIIKFQFASL